MSRQSDEKVTRDNVRTNHRVGLAPLGSHSTWTQKAVASTHVMREAAVYGTSFRDIIRYGQTHRKLAAGLVAIVLSCMTSIVWTYISGYQTVALIIFAALTVIGGLMLSYTSFAIMPLIVRVALFVLPAGLLVWSIHTSSFVSQPGLVVEGAVGVIGGVIGVYAGLTSSIIALFIVGLFISALVLILYMNPLSAYTSLADVFIRDWMTIIFMWIQDLIPFTSEVRLAIIVGGTLLIATIVVIYNYRGVQILLSLFGARVSSVGAVLITSAFVYMTVVPKIVEVISIVIISIAGVILSSYESVGLRTLSLAPSPSETAQERVDKYRNRELVTAETILVGTDEVEDIIGVTTDNPPIEYIRADEELSAFILIDDSIIIEYNTGSRDHITADPLFTPAIAVTDTRTIVFVTRQLTDQGLIIPHTELLDVHSPTRSRKTDPTQLKLELSSATISFELDTDEQRANRLLSYLRSVSTDSQTEVMAPSDPFLTTDAFDAVDTSHIRR